MMNRRRVNEVAHMITRICLETSTKRVIIVILRREVNCLEQSVPTVKLRSLILKRKSVMWLGTRDQFIFVVVGISTSVNIACVWFVIIQEM